ncbi:MAG: DNA-binding protein [Bacteroidales bacterium]|nr:DNA-binding protein [Bacteroidales bacterium]
MVNQQSLSKHHIQLLTIFVVFIIIASSCTRQRTWDEDFRQPSAETAPWTFWYWMYGAVSDEGIRKDLIAMKQAGIAGFYLMPIKSSAEDRIGLGGKADQLTEEWWREVDLTTRIADSLGLQVGIHISDGFALAGGPWISEKESMQRVVWSDTIVKGGGEVDLRIPIPQHNGEYYNDIATYAFPAKSLTQQTPRASVEFPFRSKEPADIIFTYDKPFTLRSVKIVTGGNNYQAHRWTVSASEDGKQWQEVGTITPDRQGWQNTDAYATYALRPTTARQFKFSWTPVGSEPGCEDMDAAKWAPVLKVAALVLSEEPVINAYEGKSGAVWRVSSAKKLDDKDCISLEDVIRCDIDRDGRISATLPEGVWHIRRVGHASTGHTNATGGGGRGLECDKFSSAAVRKQAENWFGQIRSHVPHPEVITRLHIDSWECGSQNWSLNFADEFKRRRGYDIKPWLLTMTGVPMVSYDESDRILRDVRQTIADLTKDVFFKTVREYADEQKLPISSESVCPTMVSDGIVHYEVVDYPMGEFWLGSPTHDKPNDIADAVSGAHVYGKPVVQAEGFTDVRATWDETPAMLKPLLDRNYCLGINAIVYHVTAHNPFTDRRPGLTLDGIGVFFQRDNTWWHELASFSTYAMRCQALLRRGEPVVDLAVFAGDEIPRRSLLPEKLVGTFPGLFGSEVVDRERQRLENDGIPMETSPVGVRHTKNMTKADSFINPLRGYKYDTFTADALRGIAVLPDGSVRMRSGMTYRALIVPQPHKMNPDGINHHRAVFDSLRSVGARIIDDVWTADDLSGIGIRRDAELPTGVDYAHRTSADEEIYFLSNQSDTTQTFSPKFRSVRKNGYICDPVEGRIYNYDGSVTLPVGGSVFIVFSDTHVATSKQFTAESEVTLNNEWTLWFHDNGAYVVLPDGNIESWSSFEDPRIKYYSGHVTYKTKVELSAQQSESQSRIAFEELRDIATVIVNGRVCGTTWCEPYSVDVSGALKEGENEIAIVCVNTWANALLGAESGTPPFEGIWTNAKYRRAEGKPLPGGIIGRVRLQFPANSAQ